MSAGALGLRIRDRIEEKDKFANKKVSEDKTEKQIEGIETTVSRKIELVETENKELKRQITALIEAHIQH